MEFSTVFRKKRVNENVLLPSAVFQMALAQNNPYVKVASFGVSYSAALHSLMGYFTYFVSEIQGPLNPWSLKSCRSKQGSQSPGYSIHYTHSVPEVGTTT